MRYKEVKGNLFDVKDATYVHCISLDCAMGAGIAVAFDKKYRFMKEYVRRVIEYNDLTHPCIVPYHTEGEVINLITKERYWHRPTLKDLEITIKDLAFTCEGRNIKRIAMPKIGCGLDRLSWTDVSEIIKREFADIDIDIEVRYL